jgi:hypothetical protein
MVIPAQSNDAFETEQDYDLKETHHGPPRIHPFKPDIELEKDANFVLECESEDPITWRIVGHMENASLIRKFSKRVAF